MPSRSCSYSRIARREAPPSDPTPTSPKGTPGAPRARYLPERHENVTAPRRIRAERFHLAVSVAVLANLRAELLFVGCEEMADAVGLPQVVEVVPRRRPGGSSHRRDARIPDRGRRKPREAPRVVPRVALELLLRQRPGAWDPQPVAERRVDRQRHVILQAVVDHCGYEPALRGHDRLPLDHRGDDQDVVRVGVPGARTSEVDRPPALLEGVELLRDHLGGLCVLGELVERREEEALDAPPFEIGPERTRGAGAGSRDPVCDTGQSWRDVPLADRDLPHLGDAVGHLADGEALREDDPERDRRGLGRPGDGHQHESKCGHDGDGEAMNHAFSLRTMKKRLDVLLVERGLAESRAQAQALVMAGRVPGFDKAGQQVDETAPLELTEPPRFVSRGGHKLAHALDAFGVDPTGADCLDVGASTGGFTDVLLQRGAARVIALDVGYGQLHSRIRGDPRVVVLERVNARDLTELPFAPQLVTCDVSFISVRLALPPALRLAAPGWRALVLVKPQFEVGRAEVPKGVVRDADVRRRVLREIAEAALAWQAQPLGLVDSGLPGPKGNREFVLHLVHAEHPELPPDLDRWIADAVG